MKQTAQEILNKKDDENNSLVKEKEYKGKISFGFYATAAHLNWEEFYTYLAQGEFDDSVEQLLKTDYFQVYKIFNEIKESCKLKE